MLKKELLDVLCCPKCKATLDYNPDQQTLRCTTCGTLYPVRNNIPIMIVEDNKDRV